MGNDGSGWSMSVWPTHTDREGQDKQPKKVRSPRVKDDGKRLPTAGTITHAEKNPKSELIKAGDPRVKKKRRLVLVHITHHHGELARGTG